MEIKKCKSCLEEKKLCEFYKNSLYEDTLDYRCKTCFKNKVKSKRRLSYTNIFKCCIICKENMDLTMFPKRKTSKDGYNNKCKCCVTKKLQDHSDILHKKCTNCKELKHYDMFAKNNRSPSGVSSCCKKCKIEKYCEYNKREDIVERKKETSRNWEKDNYKQYRESVNHRRKIRRDEDFLYRLKANIKIPLRKILKYLEIEGNISDKFDSILGCTLDEFKNHIESQFLNWMNWDNYGNCDSNKYNCSWHLDHIIPISYAKTEEESYLLSHWSNFQPLCSKINKIDKRNSIYSCTNLELKITYNE